MFTQTSSEHIFHTDNHTQHASNTSSIFITLKYFQSCYKSMHMYELTLCMWYQHRQMGITHDRSNIIQIRPCQHIFLTMGIMPLIDPTHPYGYNIINAHE